MQTSYRFETNLPGVFRPNGFAFGALLRPKSQERSAEGESQWLRDSSAHLDLRHSEALMNYQWYRAGGCKVAAPRRGARSRVRVSEGSAVGVSCPYYLQRALIPGQEAGAV